MNNNWKRRLVLLVTCFWSITAIAQITPERVQQFISDKRLFSKAELLYPSDVKEFYARFNYQPAWLTKQNAESLNYLVNVLKLAAVRGLEGKDYQVGLMKDLVSNSVRIQGINDSLEAEVPLIDIDTLTQKGCLRNQAPITVHADVHMPVIVWYNLSSIDSTGRVLYFKDVYGKFDWKKNK